MSASSIFFEGWLRPDRTPATRAATGTRAEPAGAGNTDLPAELAALAERLVALLGAHSARHPTIVQVSSLGPEDMVITDLIARHRLPIEVVTLDTGRLPKETYDQIGQVQRHYADHGCTIGVIFPAPAPVEQFVRQFGIDGFYKSVQARQACCNARKVRPLARVLANRQAWITGLRRGQSAERAQIAEIETEPVSEGDGQRIKLNPLAAWSEAQVWAYLHARAVPINALHAQGYPSIGCGPCTRAVALGEDPRAGRWWWEASGGRGASRG
jgi:phosphoadenosine phosphosulfate reductase